jgi:hypothetical protein
MELNESTLKWIAAVFLCTTIIGGATSIYYMNKFNALKTDFESTIRDLEEFTILVNLLIDYGNGTIIWHNNTRLLAGTDLIAATDMVADIEYTESEWGVFLNTINGVGGDLGAWWLWYFYLEGWQMGQVGADQRILHDGDIISWVYSQG